jgi:hypothetical protein
MDGVVPMFKQILLAVAALAFGSSNAIAASQLHIGAYPSAHSEASPDVPSAGPGLHGIIAELGTLPPDGDDWPCYAGGSECSSIASGGLVIGAPYFNWSLADCDSKTKKDTDTCGQIFWMYQDDTNDTTDDLVISIVVTQGEDYILDISEDFGPNPYGAGVMHISADVAFGTIGNHTGPGNGWCYTAHTVTCSNPKAGLANVAATTTVGSYSTTQKFQINLQ